MTRKGIVSFTKHRGKESDFLERERSHHSHKMVKGNQIVLNFSSFTLGKLESRKGIPSKLQNGHLGTGMTANNT